MTGLFRPVAALVLLLTLLYVVVGAHAPGRFCGPGCRMQALQDAASR